MPRCPVCESGRVLIVLRAKPEARCLECAASWIQEGEVQRRVVRPPDPAPA